jgi:hypothetical protein
MKRCTRCNIEKDEKEFYKNKRKKDGLDCWCKECSYITQKKWAKDNPKIIQKKNERYRIKNKDKIHTSAKQSYFEHKDQWKEILSKICAQLNYNNCIDCGNLEFEFHHPDSTTKEFNISTFIGERLIPTQQRIDILIAEIKKCIPMCKPCHQKWHNGIRKHNPDGTFI